ncbi:pentatricopeptide repeat-containing protein At3g26782, mitochondrial-like isoform X2 [Tripterygium wilfordii]|nr:pentatricopeptide repeat-containing protein At3g26782, mitochondrial-like isoform X2 [Tripterygium wilfordii]
MNVALYLKLVKSQYPTLFKISPYTTTAIKTSLTEQCLAHPPLSSLWCGSLLQSLTNSKFLNQGNQLHAHITVCGTLCQNTYLSTKLAAFYAGCGQMDAAQVIFDGILLKNSFLWNFMIRGYACNAVPLMSIVLSRKMLYFGRKADNFTYPFVLKACGDSLVVEIGRKVHGEIVVAGFESDIYVCNSLLAMYSKFGDMGSARKVFDKMLERDLTSWNTMILGYVKVGNPQEALAIFGIMAKSVLPADGTTLLGLISACAKLAARKQGKSIHGFVVTNSPALCNEYLINSLIDMYCHCNSIIDARRLFEEATFKDSVSWNSMISGYARNGDAFESLRLFCRMVIEGAETDQVTFTAVLGACDRITALQFGMSVHSCLIKKGFGANTIVGTALIDMYAKCGCLACSCFVFDKLPEKNLVSWSSMISGYGIHGMGREAISCFDEMLTNNILPDDSVLTSVLSACSHAGLVAEGKEIFRRMTKDYDVKPTVAHYSCLVDMLGRAGHLDEAYELIETMEIKPTSDVWAALLNACWLHRNAKLGEISAQKLFDMSSNEVTSYICLSNIYAAERRWDDTERVRAIAKGKGLRKTPGCSFVELNKAVHTFLVGDRIHPQAKKIYAKLEDLNQRLKEAGYIPDTSSVLHNVEEEIKEKMLWDHSERLAIAFALINTAPGTIIRITKNLRVCRDCHTVTKFISKVMHREIIMRDIRRFHHFKDGVCSCGDY